MKGRGRATRPGGVTLPGEAPFRGYRPFREDVPAVVNRKAEEFEVKSSWLRKQVSN